MELLDIKYLQKWFLGQKTRDFVKIPQVNSPFRLGSRSVQLFVLYCLSNFWSKNYQLLIRKYP